MKLYGIYKNGVLYKVSYEQNTPFYSSLNGAKRALMWLKKRYKEDFFLIYEFEVLSGKEVE